MRLPLATRVPGPLRYVLGFVLGFLGIMLFYWVVVLDESTSTMLGVLLGFAIAWAITGDRMRSIIGALASITLVAPYFFSAYDMSQIVVLSIIAISLNIVTGYAGQISLGHGALAAVGAYTTAILMKDHGWAWWQTAAVAAVLTTIVGFIIGLPSLRLSGPYLAMATLTLAIVLPIAIKAKHFEDFTHGVQGILIRKPKPPGWLPSDYFPQDVYLYFIALAFGALMIYLAYRLLRTRHGRAFIALRDSEVAAQVMGISLARYKTAAFAVSAFLAGIGGVLYAITVGFVSPDSFSLFFSIEFLVMIVLGGVESILGSIIGAALYWELSLKVPSIKFHTLGMNADFSPWIVFGLILVLVTILMPYGIAGFFYRLPSMRGPRWAARLRPGVLSKARVVEAPTMANEATPPPGSETSTDPTAQRVVTRE
jgi:branched-chain amino acid transport system permease protein